VTTVDPLEAPPSGADGSAELARTAVRGGMWTGASQLSGKLLFFLSTVLLARMLDQDDFGVAAYAITVIALFNAVPSLGLAPALIHYPDDPGTLSTGFWLGLAAGVSGFVLVWFMAPLTESFFGDPRAVPVTRGLALIFPLQALRNVHSTLLQKRLDFRRRFVPDLIQSLAKGGVGIVLALLGFGAWSLIGGIVAAAGVGVPAYWYAARWHPSWRFEPEAARRLVPFGAHVVGVGLLGALVRNLDYLLVGRLLGAATLGVYVLAFRIPDLLIRNLAVMLGQVLLPLYARAKNEPELLRQAFLATTSYVFAITAPMAVGLALVAEPLILTVFSAKWIEVVPVIPPVCLYALFISLSFNVGDLYKALGRPEILTRLALVRATLVVGPLWYATAVVGTAAAVGWAQAGVALVTMVLNFVVAGALFDLPIRAALIRLMPVVGATAVMAAVTIGVGRMLSDQTAALRLLVAVAAGAASYLVALRAFAREFVETGAATLRDALTRRRAAVGGTG
jgi:PST family polysaccharide transporter